MVNMKNLKKHLIIFAVFLMGFTILPTTLVHADTPFTVPAKAAIAVDQKSGKILYAQNATQPMGLASITKILTAYVVLNQIKEGKLSWDDKVPVKGYAFALTQNADASNMMVNNEGDSFTVRDMFNALMIQSANSSAIALAEKVAGSEPKFVDMMRKQAQAFGITDAHIVNASGLNNSMLLGNIYPGSDVNDENQMSAQDIAVIAEHLITDFPDVLNVTKQTTAVFDKGGTSEQNLHTYNYMLQGYQNYRTGVDGLKTGTTTFAGACFVATTTQNGFRIITVVLNADGGESDEYARFNATNSLMNYVYGSWTTDALASKGETYSDFSSIKVIDGKSSQLGLVASDDLNPIVPMVNSVADTSHLSVTYQKPDAVTAPIKQGTGIVRVTTKLDSGVDNMGYLPGYSGQSITLVAKNNVDQTNTFTVLWNKFVRFVNRDL